MANPIDVVIVGTNLETFGFLGLNYGLAGLGLNTFGFLWPCDAIWVSADLPVTTTWVGCTMPSNTVEDCSH